MSVSRDEFDRLVGRVDSLERQNRAIISLLSEQVVTITPQLTATIRDGLSAVTVGLGEHMDERFATIDAKLDRIIERLDGGP